MTPRNVRKTIRRNRGGGGENKKQKKGHGVTGRRSGRSDQMVRRRTIRNTTDNVERFNIDASKCRCATRRCAHNYRSGESSSSLFMTESERTSGGKRLKRKKSRARREDGRGLVRRADAHQWPPLASWMRPPPLSGSWMASRAASDFFRRSWSGHHHHDGDGGVCGSIRVRAAEQSRAGAAGPSCRAPPAVVLAARESGWGAAGSSSSWLSSFYSLCSGVEGKETYFHVYGIIFEQWCTRAVVYRWEIFFAVLLRCAREWLELIMLKGQCLVLLPSRGMDRL